MAAASFLFPNLGLWNNAKIKRIRHSPRVNYRSRRQRTTPPLTEEFQKRMKINRELEIIQERHIRHKIREYLKPFKIFLGLIGRFPFTVEDERQKKSLIHAIKKTSCTPIIDIGVIQEQGLEDLSEDSHPDEGPSYKYDPKSGKGIAFYFTTIFCIFILILACVGYADLNITEHHYKDILLKEINGELICTNTSVDPRKLLPRNRRAGFLPSSRHYQQEVLNWNCSYAARLLSTCYDSYAAPQDLGTNPLSSVPDPQRIKACETAVSLKKSVDGSMIFLIIIFSSLLNTIVQSTIPIFKGERVAKFLTSWSRDLARTRFDVSDGIRKKVIAELILVTIVAFTFALMYFLPHYVFSSSGIHLVQDTVKAIRIVLIRPFATDPLDWDQHVHPYILEVPILILILLLVASYKGYVFFYGCVCQSLSNGFKEWNKKAEDSFSFKLTQAKYSKNEGTPCSLDHLVNSHFTLLKLVNDTNDILGVIVGGFFATHIVIICFEMYFIIEMGFSGGWISVCALAILVQTTSIVIIVALSASHVHEEALNGFEALRGAYRNHLNSEEERMLQTLLTSFSGPPIMLSGGKFFGLHRPFLLTVIGFIITYFFVMLQMMKLG